MSNIFPAFLPIFSGFSRECMHKKPVFRPKGVIVVHHPPQNTPSPNSVLGSDVGHGKMPTFGRPAKPSKWPIHPNPSKMAGQSFPRFPKMHQKSTSEMETQQWRQPWIGLSELFWPVSNISIKRGSGGIGVCCRFQVVDMVGG